MPGQRANASRSAANRHGVPASARTVGTVAPAPQAPPPRRSVPAMAAAISAADRANPPRSKAFGHRLFDRQIPSKPPATVAIDGHASPDFDDETSRQTFDFAPEMPTPNTASSQQQPGAGLPSPVRMIGHRPIPREFRLRGWRRRADPSIRRPFLRTAASTAGRTPRSD